MKSKLDLRYGNEHDKIPELWEICFNEPYPFKSRTARAASVKNSLVIAEDKTVYAMLHFEKINIRLDGRTISAGYLYGIGTHPDTRKKHYCKGLLGQALFELYLRGIPLACLIPGSEDVLAVYEKSGFVPLGSRFVCNRPVPQLVDKAKPKSIFSAADPRPAVAADIPQLDAFYRAAFPNGWNRTQRDWRKILSDYNVFLIADGYLVVCGERVLEETPLPPDPTPHPLRPLFRVTKAETLYRHFPEKAEMRHAFDPHIPWNNRYASVGPEHPCIENVFLGECTPHINLKYNIE